MVARLGKEKIKVILCSTPVTVIVEQKAEVFSRLIQDRKYKMPTVDGEIITQKDIEATDISVPYFTSVSESDQVR